MAVAEGYSQCLLGAMDTLWFHKIILFSEPIIDASPIIQNTPILSSSSSSSPSSISSQQIDPFSDVEDFSTSDGSPTISTTSKDDFEVNEDDGERAEETVVDLESRKYSTPTSTRPKLRMIKNRIESNSSQSTPTHRRRRRHRAQEAAIKPWLRVLERTISCKSYAELEQQEVKGFVDLGFTFDKDRLTPRMMSVIPGLQRLEGGGEGRHDPDDGTDQLESSDAAASEEDNQQVVRNRPYLSEAWLIKRPDSPLLRLRMPAVSTTTSDDHMKWHLKLWAKTVASALRE